MTSILKCKVMKESVMSGVEEFEMKCEPPVRMLQLHNCSVRRYLRDVQDFRSEQLCMWHTTTFRSKFTRI